MGAVEVSRPQISGLTPEQAESISRNAREAVSALIPEQRTRLASLISDEAAWRAERRRWEE